MSYKVEFAPRAAREFLKPPRDAQERIRPAIDALAKDPRPRGCVKLEGEKAAFRVRAGDFRIVYEVFDHVLIVRITRVAHRRDAYRR